MFISVRGCSVKTAGGCRQLYGLSVMSQVSNVLRNHAALVIIALVIILMIRPYGLFGTKDIERI